MISSVCTISFFALEQRASPTIRNAPSTSAPIRPAPWNVYGWFGAMPLVAGSVSSTLHVRSNAALTCAGDRYVDSDQFCSLAVVSHDSIAGGAM